MTDTWTIYMSNPSARLDVSTPAALGLPVLGSPHPLSEDLELVEYRVKEHEPGQLFREVECVYESGGENESEGEGSQAVEVGRLTALDWPAYTATGDLVSDQVTGAEVLNSAGDVFDSVPQYEETWIGVHFVRRVRNWPSGIIALAGTVNSARVTIYGVTFEPRTARLRVGCRYLFDGSKRPYELDITVEPRHMVVDTNTSELRPVGIENNYSMDGTKIDVGWDVALLDCGFQYLDSGGNPVRFTVEDETGNRSAPQLPQLLDADGHDGRDASHKSFFVVQTAIGNDWQKLKAKERAPGQAAPSSDGGVT